MEGSEQDAAAAPETARDPEPHGVPERSREPTPSTAASPGQPEKSVLGLWFARLSASQRIAVVVAVLVIVGAAIAVPVSLSGGGGDGHTYPANVRANFLRACEANASSSLCHCALTQIESQVSLHQFAQDELSYERTGQLPSYYRTVVYSCLAK